MVIGNDNQTAADIGRWSIYHDHVSSCFARKAVFTNIISKPNHSNETLLEILVFICCPKKNMLTNGRLELIDVAFFKKNWHD